MKHIIGKQMMKKCTKQTNLSKLNPCLKLGYPFAINAPVPSASFVDFSIKSKFVSYRKTEIILKK